MNAELAVNGERLENMIEEFANFGRTENNGVTRLALSEEDINVRKHFKEKCEGLGLDVTWDDLGNMYAKLEGHNNNAQPIVVGSHLDSVSKGGRFDGVLGVLVGLEVVQTLIDNQIKPKMPIIVANITNEEGARFEPAMMSSGILSEWFDEKSMFNSKDKNGITFGEALKSSGFEGDKKNRLNKALAFLELHIEQGPVLENEKIDIGVVEGVMGMVNYQIEENGDSNHAGTTPMKYRKDALFATNNIINQLRSKLDNIHDTLVYTIGRLNVFPNIHTVIPKSVTFTIESRHENADVLRETEKVINNLKENVDLEGCEILVNKQWDRETVWFDKRIVQAIQESSDTYKFSYKKMISGAGHDSQFLSSFIPTAMIFVPSINGKSHSEDELTPFQDCENGANVMLGTVLELI